MTTAETSRTGNIVAALATVAACDIAFGLTLQLIPLLMNEQGWPAWAIGLNAAMGPIGILMAGPFLPRILGRVGTKRATLAIIRATASRMSGAARCSSKRARAGCRR